MPNSENSPDSLGSSPDSLGWSGYSVPSTGFSGVYPGTAVNPEVPSLQLGSSGFKWVKIFTSKFWEISMAIKFQNYYGCSRSWNLLLSRANTLKIKSSQRGFVKPGSSGFLEPGSSGFQPLYHYLARDLPFHPSFTLSHTARHFPVRERRFCGDSRI